MEWYNEKVDKIKNDKFLYNFICFFIGGFKYKMSYKELYLLLYGLNRKRFGDERAKIKSMTKIVEIYKENHNNNMPKFENDEFQ